VNVLFVCLHGAAKSVIAAEYLVRLARSAGHEINAVAAGLEPDDEIPPHVVRGLAEDGFDVSGRTPRRLTQQAITDADLVVSFGCPVQTGSTPHTLMSWDDVPAVSDGYVAAREAIVGRLRTLLADKSLVQLAQPAKRH
jgi:protein-tyrosine-phosphatase